ncbi:hypothetical protein [Porphyromonas sp.]|uniref:hypothetical protein n=1 Tax=Porphyromonas sp. TaxID=1924944 RepID=UPI0026DB1542|nr:hypothetical protein [Porphyromonas sp.]MDO4771309.1 hypothetical protein [Porphyromonas sp.]
METISSPVATLTVLDPDMPLSIAYAEGLTKDVDTVLGDVETLNDTEISVHGLCTHACRHAGRKVFLRGSERRQVLRIEAGEIGGFDHVNCTGKKLCVRGILREQRIDENFLQRWEARLRERQSQGHSDPLGGCSADRQSRGETAITVEDRIAAFREKIAKRTEESGKDYLSFYHIVAKDYTILP